MISAIGPSLDGIGLHFTRDLFAKMPGQRWIVRSLELQTDRRTMAQGPPADCEGPAEQRNGLSAFRLDDPKATVDVTREYEFALSVDVHSPHQRHLGKNPRGSSVAGGTNWPSILRRRGVHEDCGYPHVDSASRARVSGPDADLREPACAQTSPLSPPPAEVAVAQGREAGAVKSLAKQRQTFT